MRALKIVCLLFSLLSVASVLTGVRAVNVTTSWGLNITKQPGVGALLWSVFNALLYASAAYGIQKRLPVVWKLGWVVLVVSSLEFMIRAMGSATKVPGSWVLCIGILVGAVAVTVYWGAWWNRQMGYFRKVGPD